LGRTWVSHLCARRKAKKKKVRKENRSKRLPGGRRAAISKKRGRRSRRRSGMGWSARPEEVENVRNREKASKEKKLESGVSSLPTKGPEGNWPVQGRRALGGWGEGDGTVPTKRRLTRSFNGVTDPSPRFTWGEK